MDAVSLAGDTTDLVVKSIDFTLVLIVVIAFMLHDTKNRI
jgi:hypothetical protein